MKNMNFYAFYYRNEILKKVNFLLKHVFNIPPSLYSRNSLRMSKKTFSIFFDIFVKKIFEHFGQKFCAKTQFLNIFKNFKISVIIFADTPIFENWVFFLIF